MKKTTWLVISVSFFSGSLSAGTQHDITYSWKKWIQSDQVCDGGYYNSPNSYVCPRGLTLERNDSIIASKDMTILVYGGKVDLKGKNDIGDVTNKINITVSSDDFLGDEGPFNIYGDVNSFGKVQLKKRVYVGGDISSSHDEVILSNATIDGDVTSGDKVITEGRDNLINGSILAHDDITLKKSIVKGNVTSSGGEVKIEESGNEIYGNIKALKDIELKGTKVVGNVTSEGHEVELEDAYGGNSVFGRVTALHEVEIKNSLVCGEVISLGSEVKLEQSQEGRNKGIYAYTNAIQASHKATVKNSSVCGSVVGHSYDFDNEKSIVVQMNLTVITRKP
ncbi:hypothetical protein JCM19052_4843 [Vibrio sp. JCM 19052]|nr:hypothetical protein JCM19052_4843 [Vibrio sp. JCM 19052]